MRNNTRKKAWRLTIGTELKTTVSAGVGRRVFNGTDSGIRLKPDKFPVLNFGKPLRQSPVKLSTPVILYLKG